MIDVLVLTRKDLANMAWRTAECLKLLGLNVRAYKGHSHMDYSDQCDVIQMESKSKIPLAYKCLPLQKKAERARVLHFTSGTFIDTGVNVTKKKVVFQYGGRPYIGNPFKGASNMKFVNGFVDHTIVHHPCLLNKGARNETLIKPPVDTDKLQPEFDRRNNRKIIIGHFPSNEIVKGTEIINGVIENLNSYKDRFEYFVETERVPWDQQLERMKGCDVIIECLTPKVKGTKFGEWSTAAMESAALGKITVTNSFNDKLYVKYYGQSQLVIANNRKQMASQLKKILEMTDREIMNKKIKTREWIVNKHGMEATAIALWDRVYKHLFPERKPRLIYEK